MTRPQDTDPFDGWPTGGYLLAYRLLVIALTGVSIVGLFGMAGYAWARWVA